ncbi:hypothetical protein Y032_0184g988 [Ancylostoma ceylanicum]|uniref:SCP domain-containing protein n=1 Tax=Ancylostoma ceylanicum TaxID=53326 RepID=A0A016SS81_9BILA|nr:hypothetical protein Y032_0184g988 [Ancylostoma ceylanicum]
MTDQARQKFLDMHNSYRSQVAKGQAKDALSGYAPRAAKMKKMVWLSFKKTSQVSKIYRIFLYLYQLVQAFTTRF